MAWKPKAESVEHGRHPVCVIPHALVGARAKQDSIDSGSIESREGSQDEMPPKVQGQAGTKGGRQDDMTASLGAKPGDDLLLRS